MISIDDLGRTLASLQLVTDEQVATARRMGNTLDSLLAALAAQPAWWSPRDPALTAFQRRQITKRLSGTVGGLRNALCMRHYLVLTRLGQGGGGVVYKGWDLKGKRYVALKVIRVDNPTTRLRVRNEYRAMRRLDGIPGVVRAFGMFATAHTQVLVMEYQNQGDLRDLAGGKSLKWRTVVRWAATLLEGLQVAHEKGLVHRDIKPQNVMVHRTPDRDLVRLSDWGVVKQMGESGGTQQFQLLGSFDYMAPEQWMGATEAVPASDIYSLGCTLYHVLAGRPPFAWNDDNPPRNPMAALCSAHMHQEPPSVRAARPDVPEAVDALLRRMMDKDPARRGTAASVRDELAALVAPRPPAPPPTPPPSGALRSPEPRGPAVGDRRDAVVPLRPSTGERASALIPPPAAGGVPPGVMRSHPSGSRPASPNLAAGSVPPGVVGVVRPPAAPERPPALPRPLSPPPPLLTPAGREAAVPLGEAFESLVRIFWRWLFETRNWDPLTGVTERDVQIAWRRFLRSGRAWCRGHPVAAALLVLVPLGLVAWLVFWAV